MAAVTEWHTFSCREGLRPCDCVRLSLGTLDEALALANQLEAARIVREAEEITKEQS